MEEEILRGSPMLMTGEMIRSAIRGGTLRIDNFSDSHLQPASYDARLGEEAITSSHREKINPAHKGLLTSIPKISRVNQLKYGCYNLLKTQ